MVPFVNGWLVGMTAPRCKGLRVAMGATAKQSGSSGVEVDYLRSEDDQKAVTT